MQTAEGGVLIMNTKRLLLLNGSPRKKGTSYSFARTIKMLVEGSGNTAEIIHVIDYIDGKEALEGLKGQILQSDTIAMIAPLYADTLPYVDIWFLEKLIGECDNELRGKCFFAIGQCGFPDITRIEPLLNSCRIFAEETKMKWLGGLAYGGGAMINGSLLESFGKQGEKITLGFKLALENILKGEKISSKSQDIITVRIPKPLYWPLAAYLNNNARKQARENGNIDYKKKVYLE
jgi:multimeric flavodoxin WrbA